MTAQLRMVVLTTVVLFVVGNCFVGLFDGLFYARVNPPDVTGGRAIQKQQWRSASNNGTSPPPERTPTSTSRKRNTTMSDQTVLFGLKSQRAAVLRSLLRYAIQSCTLAGATCVLDSGTLLGQYRYSSVHGGGDVLPHDNDGDLLVLPDDLARLHRAWIEGRLPPLPASLSEELNVIDRRVDAYFRRSASTNSTTSTTTVLGDRSPPHRRADGGAHQDDEAEPHPSSFHWNFRNFSGLPMDIVARVVHPISGLYVDIFLLVPTSPNCTFTLPAPRPSRGFYPLWFGDDASSPHGGSFAAHCDTNEERLEGVFSFAWSACVMCQGRKVDRRRRPVIPAVLIFPTRDCRMVGLDTAQCPHQAEAYLHFLYGDDLREPWNNSAMGMWSNVLVGCSAVGLALFRCVKWALSR